MLAAGIDSHITSKRILKIFIINVNQIRKYHLCYTLVKCSLQQIIILD